MSFQKPPLTPELIAQNRAESHARLVRLAGRSPTLALQSFIDEEVAHLEAKHGRDDRLLYVAITNLLMEVEDRSGSYAFVGDALLEAVEIVQRFDEGESFDDPMLAGWARYMRECGRKVGCPSDDVVLALATTAPGRDGGSCGLFANVLTGVAEPCAPFRLLGETLRYDPTLALFLLDYGETISWELEEAFNLASDRAGETFFGQLLREGLRSVLFSKKYLGMKFDRDRDEMVGDWLAKLRVPPGYVPRGNPRTLLSFFKKRFSYRLWDQKRRVGDHTVVRLGWLADMKRRGYLESDAALTEQAIADLRDVSAARMTRPPPDGFVTSAGLAGILQERRELGDIALRMVEAERSGSCPDQLKERILASPFISELYEWSSEPASTRERVPPGAILEKLATSRRSVDTLVGEYEKQRGSPFVRDSRDARSRLIPLSEVEQIVVFATARASRKRARDGSRHPPAEPPA